MSNLPAASVIIATRGRPDLLSRCLKTLAVAAQTAPLGAYEVIVTDDDPGRSAIEMLRVDFPWVRVATGPSLGPSAARNIAAALSRAPLLIFTDDDCVPSADFVQSYIEAGALVMYGPTTCRDGCGDPFETAPGNPDGQYTFGCNLACAKKTFDVLGGFDEAFLFYGFEDYDFFARVRDLGITATLVPQAVIDHPPRPLSPAIKRVRTLKNYFRYQLKHGLSPSLGDVLSHLFANWRNRLRLRVSFARRLRAVGSFFAEFLLTLALYDRLLTAAQNSLPQSQL